MIKHNKFFKSLVLFKTILLVAGDLQSKFVDIETPLLIEGVSKIVQQSFVSNFEPINILFGNFEKKSQLEDMKDQLLKRFSTDLLIAISLQEIEAFTPKRNHRHQNVLVFLEHFVGFQKVSMSFVMDTFN